MAGGPFTPGDDTPRPVTEGRSDTACLNPKRFVVINYYFPGHKVHADTVGTSLV